MAGTSSTPGGQLALTNSFRSTTHPSKVPMFLQKLYTILEDPTTDDVISWSNDGTSFYVHDQDALAKHHLPHWFKHNKFSSFVRQLNMYGFHKIPHLQQGLISDGAEQSQFMHPYFQRGHEDQLVFIERKKQMKEMTSPDPATDQNLLGIDGGNYDMATIMSSIISIKNTQAQITQDLNDLKQADRVLWDEAHKSRQRYDQQQDAINRIVKFLANLLGQLATTHTVNSKVDDIQSSNPFNPPRLMIEARRRSTSQATSPMTVQPSIVESPSPSVGNNAAYDLQYQSSPSHRVPSPNLATALSSISPQEWAKVLSSTGWNPDFLSPAKCVDYASQPLPHDLSPFNSTADVEKSVASMDSDISNLTSLLGINDNQLHFGYPLAEPSMMSPDVASPSPQMVSSPVDNLKGTPFNLSQPPPAKAKKRKPERDSPPPIAPQARRRREN